MIYISLSRWWSALWRSSVLPLTGERGIVLLGLTARCILTTWNIKAVTEWRNTVWGRYSWACARDYGDVRLRWVVFEVAPRGGGLKCVLLLLHTGGRAEGHLLQVTHWPGITTLYSLTLKYPNYPFNQDLLPSFMDTCFCHLVVAIAQYIKWCKSKMAAIF